MACSLFMACIANHAGRTCCTHPAGCPQRPPTTAERQGCAHARALGFSMVSISICAVNPLHNTVKGGTKAAARRGWQLHVQPHLQAQVLAKQQPPELARKEAAGASASDIKILPTC